MQARAHHGAQYYETVEMVVMERAASWKGLQYTEEKNPDSEVLHAHHSCVCVDSDQRDSEKWKQL